MYYALAAIGALVLLGLVALLAFRTGGSEEAGTEEVASDEARGPSRQHEPTDRAGRRRRRSSAGSTAQTSGRGGGESPDTSAVAEEQHWLIGASGEVEGQNFHVGQRSVTLGRKPANFIQLGDEGVSRTHCQVRASSPGSPELIDLSSKTGTFLDGERLEPHEPRQLEEGARIELGDVTFYYQEFGSHDVDHAEVAVKDVGGKYIQETAAGSIESWEEMLENALEHTGGDLEETADILGVEVDKLEMMLDRAGFDPEDF